jgi:hypothetical protein
LVGYDPSYWNDQNFLIRFSLKGELFKWIGLTRKKPDFGGRAANHKKFNHQKGY